MNLFNLFLILSVLISNMYGYVFKIFIESNLLKPKLFKSYSFNFILSILSNIIEGLVRVIFINSLLLILYCFKKLYKFLIL